MTTWFTTDPKDSTTSLTDKLASYADTLVSYELTLDPASNTSIPYANSSLECLEDLSSWIDQNDTDHDSRKLLRTLLSDIIQTSRTEGSQFHSFESPLDLMIRAVRYNNSRSESADRIKQLYVAQSDIRSLPSSLRDDLPTPDMITRIGKGDIYGSSIWLGLQPTYTPLHRDPNPNWFSQLVGEKAVRLIPPRMGDSVYADVRRKLGSPGNSRFRGAEMMDGPERDGLHRAVWIEPSPSRGFVQAILKPGDALFIPKGWWHSVTSVGVPGDLNASANWWFR
ncbi:Clavaminate synthase-like protein [Xylariaceae sp. FL1019]|nr:Clavaminate synthase-like protein [Xylariaceae sp. FL1019]